jgi:hypothetical protein
MSIAAIEKHVSAGNFLKSTRSRITLALVGLFVVLAAVIPPVVVTTLHKQQNSMGPKSTVFVPLYVYPAPGAWVPLEDVYVSPSHLVQTLSPDFKSRTDVIPATFIGPMRCILGTRIAIITSLLQKCNEWLTATGSLPIPRLTSPS